MVHRDKKSGENNIPIKSHITCLIANRGQGEERLVFSWLKQLLQTSHLKLSQNHFNWRWKDPRKHLGGYSANPNHDSYLLMELYWSLSFSSPLTEIFNVKSGSSAFALIEQLLIRFAAKGKQLITRTHGILIRRLLNLTRLRCKQQGLPRN